MTVARGSERGPPPLLVRLLLGAPTEWHGERTVSGRVPRPALEGLAGFCDHLLGTAGRWRVAETGLRWETAYGAVLTRISVDPGDGGTRIRLDADFWPRALDVYGPAALALVGVLAVVSVAGGGVGLGLIALLFLITWTTARPLWKRAARRAGTRLAGLLDRLAEEAAAIAAGGDGNTSGHPS